MKKLLLLVTLVSFFSSCTSHKKFLYFQTAIDEAGINDEVITNQIQIKIQPDDMLAVSVRSLDPKAAAPFNLTRVDALDANTTSNAGVITDYLVDAEGNIDFPALGKVHLGGLTIPEAKAELLTKLGVYLKDAIVNIRFTNFKITVLGEVNRPASYDVKGEKLTVTEALGLAGDISDFGSRKDVLVIREQDGRRQFGRLNMLDSKVFNSEYYYLRQNDIIYVAPTKGKATSASFQPIGQVILPVLGVLLSLTSLLIALNR